MDTRVIREKYMSVVRDMETERETLKQAVKLFEVAMMQGSSREVALRYVTHVFARSLDDIADMIEHVYN